ncbi:hypothetical protein D0T84_19590 [Dysgonomonas sp. 521]|uniref:hypothetical protein n=1 Tax=Dysgonomonas sp. 521 TaxID=2302932 RepID=UPI0013D40FED|nr:hypothetical protein [Dysgonomonas sp. 521]NDV97089.1 hypothetical protein [Dysgonomonas sp. 521]
MLSKGIRKYVSNPVIGLLPFILYIILHIAGVQEEIALIIALAAAIAGEFPFRIHYKSRGFSVTFYISAIALIVTLCAWLFTHKYIWKPNTYVVICEVMIIALFMLLRVSKTYIAARFFRQKNLIQKALMNEFYDSAVLIQYCLTLHIFVILLYRQFTFSDAFLYSFDIVIFAVLPILIILSIGVYQIIKISNLVSKLRKEEWIPIVTEKGEVTGKIAKSVSLNMKNKFMHPIVRVALISGAKVYLQPRPVNDILSAGKLDYPFEKYMLFNHEINLAARNSIRKMIGDDADFSMKFVLKYVFENDNTKRLNFLFAASINNEDSIRRTEKMNGKFWTIKQIEEGFADELFSECFELEFEYLKNMVLLPTEIESISKAN